MWQHIDSERAWMADFLESLPREDWQRPSLCAGWTVRDVGAHLTFAQTPVRDHGVPKALIEIVTLGRTLRERAADVLAYSDRPGTSNGPTEAINSAR